jgi:hypothetical protein
VKLTKPGTGIGMVATFVLGGLVALALMVLIFFYVRS